MRTTLTLQDAAVIAEMPQEGCSLHENLAEERCARASECSPEHERETSRLARPRSYLSMNFGIDPRILPLWNLSDFRSRASARLPGFPW